MTKITKMIGERIQQRLDDLGKTQLWLAETCGTSSQTINHYCHGRKLPRLDVLERIAKALGMTLAQMVERKA